MQKERLLSRNLSPLGAWAFSIGTSIGWGSLVVTSNTYLAQAGPWGSAIGTAVGGLVMLIISVNYAYMMNIYPEAGGAYAYAREVFGYDHGFLVAWFLALTYMAILWANATSLPLFARYFLGDEFRFGRLYTVFGYDVYFGEALLSITALLLVARLCAARKRAMAGVMTVMSILFTLGITVCFVGAVIGHGLSFEPNFVPDKPVVSQVIGIAFVSPWAFIGFENISHSSEEVRFARTKFSRILLISVAFTTVLYIFVTMLSATAYPPQYGSWLEYIRDRGNLEGIEGLPAFYAAYRYMGNAGVSILMLTLLSLIITSLIGNITAVSRLLYALGKDGILPKRYATLNEHETPAKAIALVAGVSALFCLLGRTAIGWIVDVTTIGATLIYALVCATVVKLAGERRDNGQRALAIIGLAVMIGFGLHLVLPNLATADSLENESYFLFLLWSVLGFVFFHFTLKRDKQRRFGRSIVVWISLFSLVFFVSLVWLSQFILGASGAAMENVERIYTEQAAARAQAGVVAAEMGGVRRAISSSVASVTFLIALSLAMLIGSFRVMNQRARANEIQLGVVQEMANRDSLTGVKSRSAYAEKEKELDERIARADMGPFGLVVCDLNGLKLINDTQGHRSGDEYIKRASKIICDLFAHSPVYRNGGDEFVVLLMGRDYEERHALMAALHQKSVENISEDGVVISAGLSDYTGADDGRVRTVFERADAAMYEEKKLLKSMGARTR